MHEQHKRAKPSNEGLRGGRKLQVGILDPTTRTLRPHGGRTAQAEARLDSLLLK